MACSGLECGRMDGFAVTSRVASRLVGEGGQSYLVLRLPSFVSGFSWLDECLIDMASPGG